ncbi:hypothetical protein HDU83_009962 [Entophlyctis luteolus]|nr:hypothetical protein HDU83_009962 [Entophlyctis luteolus]
MSTSPHTTTTSAHTSVPYVTNGFRRKADSPFICASIQESGHTAVTYAGLRPCKNVRSCSISEIGVMTTYMFRLGYHRPCIVYVGMSRYWFSHLFITRSQRCLISISQVFGEMSDNHVDRSATAPSAASTPYIAVPPPEVIPPPSTKKFRSSFLSHEVLNFSDVAKDEEDEKESLQQPKKLLRAATGNSEDSFNDNYLVNLLDEFLAASRADSEPISADNEKQLAIQMPSDIVDQVERFIILLIRALQGFGCPTHMLEYHVEQEKVSKGLGHPAVIAIFPNYVIVTFVHNYNTHNSATFEILRRPASAQTLIVHTSNTTNVYKLQLVKELCRRVASYAMDAEKDNKKKEGILSKFTELLPKASAYISPRNSVASSFKQSVTQRFSITQKSLVRPGSGEKRESMRPAGGSITSLSRSRPTSGSACTNIARMTKKSFLDVTERKKSSTSTVDEFKIGTQQAVSDVKDPASATEMEDDEKGDELSQLKEFILHVARTGPAVYSVLEDQRQSNGSKNSIHDAPEHKHAFALIAVEDATSKLEDIIALPPLYSLQFQIVISGTLCGGLCGLTMTTLMGFGMEFGLELAIIALGVQDRADGPTTDPETAIALNKLNRCVAIDYRFKYLIFPLTSIAASLNHNAHWRQVPAMMVASFIAYIIPNYYAASLNRQIAVALAAFCAGAFANLFARFSGIPAMVPTYAAMVQLVPGSMALRSITELMGADPTSGVSLVMTVLSIALSIGLGLFMASMTITPIQNLADHMKGKHRRVDDLEAMGL